MFKSNEYFAPIVYHPGEILAEKLEELGMGSKEFSVRANKPEKTISAVLRGNSSITPDMAVQFENVTQIPAHFWMNAQNRYNEYVARKKHQVIIEEAIEWSRNFPIGKMIQLEWLPKKSTNKEKTAELLSFFGLANHHAWEDYYYNKQLKVAFRISLASTKEPYALSAWLRMGEIQAQDIKTNAYSEKEFKKCLPEIKSLMATHPDGFFEKLQLLCSKVGVKVIHTPCLPKAPINGATRWINDFPVIQISGRYQRHDIFWFTFFHEVGHILLHGKKDIFLEDIRYSDLDQQKESEADDFAIKWTLSHDEENVIVANDLTEGCIKKYAVEFNTHPGIIVGRLRHRKLFRSYEGQEMIQKIDL